MKATKLIISAALVLGAVSCSELKDEALAPKDGMSILKSITATSDATKAVLGSGENDGKILWQPGDKINLFYDGTGAEFTSTVTAPALESKFTGSLTVVYGAEETSTEKPMYGIFPYNASNTVSADGAIVAALPAIQTAVAGSFAPDAYVAVGKSSNPSMAFYAVAGGVRFKVSRSDIKSVVFKGNAGESLAGNLNVTFEEQTGSSVTAAIPTVSKVTGASTAITLNAPEGECLTAGEWYYIVAAPDTLKSGFEMTFYTANKCATFSTSTSVEIKRKTFGSLTNPDEGLTFVDKAWSLPTIVNVNTSYLGFDVNPVTGNPVLAVIPRSGPMDSNGPIHFYADIKGEPAVVTSTSTNQYLSLGVSSNGTGYVFSQETTGSKYGHVYTSSDLSSWSDAGVQIDASNAYYGRTIGCLGNQVFMMTSENSSGGSVARRNVNVTSYNGTSWTTGQVLAGRATANTYYPVIRTKGSLMYTFVTNVSKGLSLYKYDGTNWSEIVTVAVADEAYKKYTYGINEAQDMAIDSDGYIWLALGTTNPAGITVVKLDPDDPTDGFVQIGETIPLTNSISYRSARIGIVPAASADEYDKVYLVYRDDNQNLFVSALDTEDSFEWMTPERLTNASASDIEVRTSSTKAYVACEVGGHVEVFETL